MRYRVTVETSEELMVGDHVWDQNGDCGDPPTMIVSRVEQIHDPLTDRQKLDKCITLLRTIDDGYGGKLESYAGELLKEIDEND